MFLGEGDSHAPIPRGGATASPKFSDLLYMRAHGTSNSNQILHGENFRKGMLTRELLAAANLVRAIFHLCCKLVY